MFDDRDSVSEVDRVEKAAKYLLYLFNRKISKNYSINTARWLANKGLDSVIKYRDLITKLGNKPNVSLAFRMEDDRWIRIPQTVVDVLELEPHQRTIKMFGVVKYISLPYFQMWQTCDNMFYVTTSDTSVYKPNWKKHLRCNSNLHHHNNYVCWGEIKRPDNVKEAANTYFLSR